jgi:mitochondrial fission protein ELM1
MFCARTSWIITDDKKIGTHSQCLGLARGLGLTPTVKIMKPRWPWKGLPPSLWLAPLQAQSRGGDTIIPSPDEPLPDILIAAGRASAAPAAALRKRALGQGKKCFTIFLQDPYLKPHHFDCVIAPRHDHLQGNNVILTLGALHRLTEDKIKAAAACPAPPLSPVTTVLLGGDSRHYRYQAADIRDLAEVLKKTKGYFLITPSRRTRPELIQVLKDSLTGISYELWDGKSENPYLAYLGAADQFIVSGESVSMISEACLTGKPVYIWEPSHIHRKHREFRQDLYTQGYAQLLSSPLLPYHPKKLDEMSRVILLVKERLAAYFQ